MRLSPRLLDGLLLGAWLASIGAVVVHEQGAFGWMPGAPPLVAAPIDVQEQWFGLYYQGQKVGFTHLMLAPDERDGVPGVALIDDGRLRLHLLGTPQQMSIHARSFVDDQWRLRRLSAKLETGAYRLQIDGERHGDELRLTMTTPTSTRQQRLHDPSGRIWISGLSSWAAFHRLSVGQRGQLAGQLEQGLLVDVADDGDDEPALRRHRDTQVVVALQDQLARRRVEAGVELDALVVEERQLLLGLRCLGQVPP